MSILIWCDLETSGLDPREGEILEIALVVTTEQLEILNEFTTVVQPTDLEACVESMHEKVFQMHSDNGLIQELVNGDGMSLEAAEQAADKFIGDASARRALPMCGSSVHFDLSWVRHHMPALAKRFHYRIIDVSTVAQLCEIWFGAGYASRAGGRPHRALDDVKASIEALRRFKARHFSPYNRRH